jgi:hypothetical protein
MITRHEFLAHLHDVVKPERYLEIGVQYGPSLALAERAAIAIGVDPEPLLQFSPGNWRPNQELYVMTSDVFFGDQDEAMVSNINFGFIDGMHLFEYALRDFINLERRMTAKGIVVFDDVLPYSQAIAEREQPPGDWTGDVWKIHPILCKYRPGLQIRLVDTSPTGTMVVWNLSPVSIRLAQMQSHYNDIVQEWMDLSEVPQDVLQRTQAHDPMIVLEEVRDWLAT